MADFDFAGKFEVLARADAAMCLHEQVAEGQASDQSFTVHRSAFGLGMWINIGSIRVNIPISDLIQDAVVVGFAANAEAKNERV